MDIAQTTNHVPGRYPTNARRQSDLELVVTRTFDAPARIVFAAWADFEALVGGWLTGDRPFRAKLHMVYGRRFSDYDQLARVAEWLGR